MSRPVRFGPLPAVLFILLLLVYAGTGALGAVISTLDDPAAILLDRQLDRLGAWVSGIGAASLGIGLLAAVTAVATFVRAARVQRDVPGRARVLSFATSAALVLLLIPIGVALLFWALPDAASVTLPAFGPKPSLTDLWNAMPSTQAAVMLVWALSFGGELLTLLVSQVAVWFLAPKRFRRVVWAGVDVMLTLAFVFVTVTLPIIPSSEREAELTSASIRLAVTVLFAIRAIVWLLPSAMNLVEQIGFLALVAARHLRARKSSFLAAIGTLSVFAVAVSSCSLTTTLSVMGGFRNDLKRKILGNHAHITVDREEGPFEGWDPILERVRGVPGVVAASPYVSGEVMVTSATNLSGAVLRGVDPASVTDVTELERYMQRGKLEYLETPEKLLELGPEDLTGFPIISPDDDDPAPVHTEKLALQDGTSKVDSKPRPPSAEGVPDLDDVLLPAEPMGEVLPGVIVGQELARSLRLFVGDEVNIVSPLGDLGPAGPMPKSRPFRVAGIFYSGHYEYDMKYAYVLLDTAQRFLGTGDAIHGIEVKVKSLERAPEVAPKVEKAIARSDLRVRDWQETNKNLFGALALEKLAMFITLGIAILVAGFCVFGTMTLLVQEKSREVAILKAMGTPGKHVIGVFMIEGLLIGVFGASLGLGLGFVAGFLAENFPLFPMNPEVYYIERLPVHLDPFEFMAVGIAAVIVCLVATVFPAVLASRLHIVNSLRFD